MSEICLSESVIFQNPEHKPLEELQLVVQNNGIAQTIPALDKYWIDKKCFLKYERPILIDSGGRNIIGAKERWLELTTFLFDDLSWLLHLPFYKFWSTIIYNTSVMDSIISFLQEAPTSYTVENFPNDYDIKENFHRIRQNVLIVFIRLVTNIESSTEYISPLEHARLLYEKYLFTIPILMDLCQQYGCDNKEIIEKIVNSVFTLQPLYKEDLRKATTFIEQALRNIERRFEDCRIDQEGKPVLLSERGGANNEITLSRLEDMILYLLDIVSTISVFIDIYPPSINNFKIENFIIKIISVYGNTISEMYKRLDDLASKDKTTAKFMELKHRLHAVRIEMLNIYRMVIYKNISNVAEAKNFVSTSEIGEIADDFLTNLMHILSEKEFAIDYHNLYPVMDDFQKLLELYPELDTVKCDFIINSIFTFLDEPIPNSVSASFKRVHVPTTSSNTIKINQTLETEDETSAAKYLKKPSKSDSNSRSAITEVKDILCDLGEGFIERCLKHYNYNKVSVINAVLEDNLPVELQNLDHTLPFIPPDSEEASVAVDTVVGIERLNIFDNDEFDIMTKHVVDTSRIHKGKRKDKYKNLNELLNDKAHIAERKDIYSKYGIVTSEYDDEYDDTYDDQDIVSNAQDDVIEMDARPFTIPRVLRKQEINDIDETEGENDIDSISENPSNKDNFIQDPALIRARAEERRLSRQGVKKFNSQSKVVENPKGQGQTKEVLNIRNQKNKHKAIRANHNRRAGSQWKRNRGMVPS